MLGLSPLLGNRHLADHTVPPSIIASIAVASILTQGFTGWSLLISIIVAILSGGEPFNLAILFHGKFFNLCGLPTAPEICEPRC